MNSALPLVQLDATPPSAPASSPVLVEKFEPLSMIGLPSTLTVLLPMAVLQDMEILGYGMGTTGGPHWVLQTSGKLVAMPPLSLWTTVQLLKFTPAHRVRCYLPAHRVRRIDVTVTFRIFCVLSYEKIPLSLTLHL